MWDIRKDQKNILLQFLRVNPVIYWFTSSETFCECRYAVLIVGFPKFVAKVQKSKLVRKAEQAWTHHQYTSAEDHGIPDCSFSDRN